MAHTPLALLVVVAAGSLSQCASEGGAENARSAEGGAVDSASSAAATITYEEDTSAFANPERGFFHGRGRTQEQPPSDEWPGLNKSAIPVWRDTENVRVITQYYHLDPYKQSDIPADYLAVLEDDLNFVRAEGLKITPRFAYSWDRASVPAGQLNDTTEYWTLRHIDALIPVLARHADVIAFVEMGFVGLWGEFWGSDNDWTTDPPDYGPCSTVQHYVDVFPERQAARERIIQRVLDLLPQRVKLTLRYSRDKRAMFRDATGTDALPLTAAEAHTGLPKARIGFHNDSVFTGGPAEQNTFFACSDPAFVESQIAWQSQDALYVPQGGETGCPYDPVYGECAIAKSRLAQRRFDALNARWCPETVQAWRDGGCFDEIAARLGYRIRLISAVLPASSLRPGGSFELSLELVNDGYGKIYNERDLEIVARSQATGAEYFLQAQGNDPRLWLPGELKTVHIVGGIPAAGMHEGTYDLLAFLPDPAPSLRNARVANRNGDPAVERWSTYAIRLANRGVWEESTGYNDLGLDLTVTAAAEGADYAGSNWFVDGPAGP